MHPLMSNDYHLVQDYMVTKVIFLLSSGADQSVWRHETDAIRERSGDLWVRQNALLFDYTLGRFLASMPADLGEGARSRFINAFVDSIRRQDYPNAEHLWSDANVGAGTAPGTRPIPTVELTLRLIQQAANNDLPASVAGLPPEFHPPQYVS